MIGEDDASDVAWSIGSLHADAGTLALNRDLPPFHAVTIPQYARTAQPISGGRVAHWWEPEGRGDPDGVGRCPVVGRGFGVLARATIDDGAATPDASARWDRRRTGRRALGSPRPTSRSPVGWSVLAATDRTHRHRDRQRPLLDALVGQPVSPSVAAAPKRQRGQLVRL